MRFRPPFLPVLALLVATSGCAVAPAAGLGGARTAADAGDFTTAISLADTALVQDPANVEALVLRSDVRRRQVAADTVGAVDSAAVARYVADARRAAELAPTDEIARNNRTNAWLTSMSRGVRAYSSTPQDLPSARVLFRAAAEVQPDSVQGHLNYGAVLLQTNDAAGAVGPFRTAARLDPTDASTVRRLGRALLESGQTAEAVTLFEGAADRFPQDDAIRADLFAAYETSGQGAQALARYETALASATPQAEPELRLAYGIALIQADRVDDAIRELERAVELGPDNALAQYNLGAAIQRKGVALNTQANATTNDAENTRLRAERDVYFERSLPYFERARALTPAGPDQQGACTALLQVYTTLGRAAEAEAVAACSGR